MPYSSLPVLTLAFPKADHVLRQPQSRAVSKPLVLAVVVTSATSIIVSAIIIVSSVEVLFRVVVIVTEVILIFLVVGLDVLSILFLLIWILLRILVFSIWVALLLLFERVEAAGSVVAVDLELLGADCLGSLGVAIQLGFARILEGRVKLFGEELESYEDKLLAPCLQQG